MKNGDRALFEQVAAKTSGKAFQEWCRSTWIEYHTPKGAETPVEPPWGRAEYKTLADIWRLCQRPRAVWKAYLQSTDRFFDGKDPKKLRNQLSRFTAAASKLDQSDPITRKRAWSPTEPGIPPLEQKIRARTDEIRKRTPHYISHPDARRQARIELGLVKQERDK